MSVTNNIFCPECDSVLDISRTSIKKIYDIDASASASEDNIDHIEILINKLLKNENIDGMIDNIKSEQITSHNAFKNLDKAKKDKVLQNIDKALVKIDISAQAFHFCKTCSWTQKIKSGTQILSKIGGGGQSSYLNIDKYKNKINSNILPFTRNFVCTNKDCLGNKDPEKHEAVFFRVNNTMNTMYVCRACKSIWNAQ
jgi:hypothetical protein